MQSLFSYWFKKYIAYGKKDKTVQKIPTKFCKNSLNADMFLQVLEKQGKIPLGQCMKNMVTVD